MKIILAAIYPFAFMLLFLIIPFDEYVRALPNILFLILVITFPSIIKREHFFKINKVPFFILLVFFLYTLLNSVFSQTIDGDINSIKKMGLAIGLVVLYLPVQHDRKVQKAIIASSIAAILISIVSIIYSANTVEGFEFWDSQMTIEALLIDRLYLGMISVLSVLFSYYAMRKKYHPNNRYYLGAIIVNVLFVFLVVSKIAALALIAMLLLRQCYGKKRVLRLATTAGVLVLLMAALFLFKYQTQKQDANTSSYKETIINTIKNTQILDTRYTTWSCSWKILQDQGITATGIGLDRTKENLVACYTNTMQEGETKDRFIDQSYNTHNQFLDILISEGVIGLLLFIGLIVALFFYNRNNYFQTAMLVLFCLYCLVENVFHRQIGSYYIGLMLIILLANSTYLKMNDNKELKNN